MKNIQQTISELKEQISALPMTMNGKRQGITDDLRKTIVHLNQECDIGAEELCKQIGISYSAFNKWQRELKNSSQLIETRTHGFQKVKIEPKSQTEPIQTEKSNLIIDGPQGLRISGLNISEVIKIWRSLC